MRGSAAPQTRFADSATKEIASATNQPPHTSVPVRHGNRVIALLQIGPVRLRAPTQEDVERIQQLTGSVRSIVAAAQVEAALWQTRYISPAQYESLVQLLALFSRQLADWYGQHTSSARLQEPLAILQAKEWIDAHYREPITLTDVARVASMSSWQFCRGFHSATGIRFNKFFNGKRVTHAMRLLADPRNTIPETAVAAGFRSLSQFNRTFRERVGQTAGKFRVSTKRLPNGVSNSLSIVQQHGASSAISVVP